MPEALYALALLACPVVMGGMMWMMMRRPKGHADDRGAEAKRDELVALQAQIDQLKAERDSTRSGAGSRPL